MRRFLFVLFLALFAVGAVLLIGQLLDVPSGFPPKSENPSLEPGWTSRSVDKAAFTRHLLAIDDHPDRPSSGMVRVRDFSERRLPELRLARGSGRMIRTLKEGMEFDTALSAEFNRTEAGGEIRLIAVNDSADRQSFSLLFGEGILLRFQRDPDDRTESDADQEIRPELPIGIGDIQVKDLISIHHSLLTGSFRPIGFDEASSSSILLVIQIDFREGPDHRAEEEDRSTLAAGPGASALAWVDPLTATVRTVRVFDARDRLVRIYDDFAYRGEGLLPILSGFRAASIVTNSHTNFEIDDISLDWD